MSQTYDESRILICLYEYLCKDGYARISQQEVAERVKLSRVTVNKHFQDLIYAGYIVPDEKYLSKSLLLAHKQYIRKEPIHKEQNKKAFQKRKAFF